jgi:hypothetical protein
MICFRPENKYGEPDGVPHVETRKKCLTLSALKSKLRPGVVGHHFWSSFCPEMTVFLMTTLS